MLYWYILLGIFLLIMWSSIDPTFCGILGQQGDGERYLQLSCSGRVWVDSMIWKKKTKKKNRKVVGYGWIYFKNLFSSDKMLLVWILVKRKAEAYGFSNWSYLERVSLFCEWRSCFGHRSLGKQSVRHHKYVVLLQNSTSGLVHALSWPCVCSCWPWSGAHLLGKRTSVW